MAFIAYHFTKYFTEVSVHTFYSIRLGVPGRCETVFNVVFGTHILKLCTHKLTTSIGVYNFGDTITRKNFFL